ncbi:hypothetical protein D3C84_1041620 [compost metagenome]
MPASQDNFGISAANSLDGQMNYLESRATYLVESERRNRERQPGSYCALASGILPGSCCQDLPHDDLIDILRWHPSAVQ